MNCKQDAISLFSNLDSDPPHAKEINTTTVIYNFSFQSFLAVRKCSLVSFLLFECFNYSSS